MNVPPGRPTQGMTIGQYLIQRLQDYGIHDLFGIPGDYVLSLYAQLETSPIHVVGCTREDCAGFAADAYARVNGMGALCVTYCVGGLSVCNSIAGAYAEKSPVVLITGSPGMKERQSNPLLHHMVRDFRTQIDVFERICIATTELSDPVTAFREIDRVLDACARYKRPVYIDIPRDMVDVAPQIGHAYFRPEEPMKAEVLQEAADEVAVLINRAERPVIVAGIEIHRFGLQDQLVQFVERTKIPVAATLLGKSVIRETHPLYIGLYEGAMGYESVQRFVEESDLIILLGTFMTDINLGIFTANLDPGKCVYVTSEELRVRHHHYRDVGLDEFFSALADRELTLANRAIPESIRPACEPYQLPTDSPISVSRMMARLNEQLDEETIVVADIGDSLFAATELVIRGRTEFLSPAYYTSMGFSVPATLGAQVARPQARVVAICGDGAFQMTGQEMSTLVRHHYDPVIIVLDNGGYGTEKKLHPGDWKFNEIHRWQYSELPKVYGGGTGYLVRTEMEFDHALQTAWDDRSGPSILQVVIAPDDHSSALLRLGERLGARV
ncbi:MAG: alpha-keto acid decarboxylase family protein [Planctomycetales bacterium]|nr:alpha-keto acid decarboxylase family protein [Planctomycetales bacterium]